MARRAILITGGCGFVGTNLIRMLLANPDDDRPIINVDALSYAGRRENLADIENHPRYRFVQGRCEDRQLADTLMAEAGWVFHLAAESHVDRSLEDAGVFVRSNVEGTLSLLEAARSHPVEKFVQVSIDKVYGSQDPGTFATEATLLRPGTPYAATKAAADLLALSYHRSHGIPVVVTRSVGNYGPWQFPEKMIPLFITNAIEDRPLPVFGNGMERRDWLHVEDHCRGLLLAAERGTPGAIYNFSAHNEWTNVELSRRILNATRRSEVLLRFVPGRPGGDDQRLALDSAAIRRLGWLPTIDFGVGLPQTIKWYRENEAWWRAIKRLNADYRAFCERRYGKELHPEATATPPSGAVLRGSIPAPEGTEGIEAQGHG